MRFHIRWQQQVSAWGAEVAATLSCRWWGFFAAALLLALGCADMAYVHLDLPQRYPELVVGAIAWTEQNKFHDYAVLYALVLGFVVALSLIGSLAACFHRDFGAAGVDRFHELTLLLCAPAALALGALLTTRNDVMWWLRLADLLLLAMLLAAVALAGRGAGYWSGKSEPLFRSLRLLLLFVSVCAFAVPALGVAVNRLGARVHATHWMTAATTERWTAFAIAAALLLACFVASRSSDAVKLEARARRATLAAQIFLPLFFLALLPPAWTWDDGETLASGYRVTLLGKLLVIGCVAGAYAHLYGRFRRFFSTDRDIPPMQLISTGCAIAVLMFLKTMPAGLPVLNADDYHFGEQLLPWWSWADKGLLPFWDYAPVRGLVNYVPGLLNQLVFGGIPASLDATSPYVYVVVALIAVSALKSLVGPGIALLALLIGPSVNGLGEIDLVVAAFLCVVCRGYFRWRLERWLAAFAALAVALLLFAPGQGALVLLACAPLGLAVAWRLFVKGRRRLFLTLTVIAVGLMAVLATPVRKMLWAAVRYGAEQSAINSVAHGIDWGASFGKATSNPWAFELMRASWLLVSLWAAVTIFRALFLKGLPTRRRLLVLAVPVFLVTVLFIVRAAGRIDEGGSRFAIAGSWALCLLLPLLLFSSKRFSSVHLLGWLALAGLTMPYSGGLIPSYAANFEALHSSRLDAEPNTRLLGDKRLGSALIDKQQLIRLGAVRRVLDAVLDPGETYLDFTGRHAVYFYVDRAPPIESGSMYNLVGERQQLRAIEALRRSRPPVVLLQAENIVHDGGPSSLRSNLVYRDVLLATDYRIATVGPQVWLIRADRVSRLVSLAGAKIEDIDEAGARSLDTTFAMKDLKELPASWGRSAVSLEKTWKSVRKVSPDALMATHDVKRTGPGQYAVTGADPYMRFDLSAAQVRGRDVGLLSFDFACELATEEPAIELYWTTSRSPESRYNFFGFRGKQGRLIVPVDSAPTWLLADRILSIRFDVEEQLSGCRKFSIRNIELLRRSAA